MSLWSRNINGKRTSRARAKIRNCGLLALVVALLATGGAQAAAASEEHALDVRFNTHLRYEFWDARAPETEDFVASRSRLGLKYDWQNTFSLFGEAQFALVTGLTDNASGAAAVYRADTEGGMDDTNSAVKVTQLWLDAQSETAKLRIGRQVISMGTLTTYPEADWTYLKRARLSQRLVGPVGWTHGMRSYDGASGLFKLAGADLHVFAAQPTTGVFAIRTGYEQQKDVLVGAADLTVRRGTAMENTEMTAFILGYSDTREPADIAGLSGDIRIYTLGGSLLGVYPMQSGRLDALLWGAYQVGTYNDTIGGGVHELDHNAWALIGEIGYQFTSLPMAPWLRTGINAASGDDDPNDDAHNTFFNVLPTNHPYYGYADQLAFQNLINWFAQLKLKPTDKLAVEVFLHRFWLANDNDTRYFGTGAFNRKVLGFGRSPSNGSRDVGTEADVVVSYRIGNQWSLAAGYAYMSGGDVFEGQDTRWAFGQVAFTY